MTDKPSTRLPDIKELTKQLGTDDPVFTAWRDALPDKHWARTDLSALRLGYELGKAAQHPKVESAEHWRQAILECPVGMITPTMRIVWIEQRAIELAKERK